VREALTLLMGLYGNALYNYCRHLVGDAALADDAHQITFAQAYQDFPRYSGRSSLRIWLYAIARHRCMDMLKMNRRRERHIGTRETLPEAETSELSAEQRAAVASQGRHLARCLEELSPPSERPSSSASWNR
jgi:RNA polymerase sigma-70 factor (ECF subfamily)